MKRIYRGKTKDLFLWSGDRLMIRFKDDLTGTGESPDPGGNEVVGSLAGKGSASLALSVYFFEFLERAGVATHYIERGPDEESLIVKKAQSFNLEVICREKAWGSFLRRYGSHIAGGEPLPSLVEFTLKMTDGDDPPICKDTGGAQYRPAAEIDYMGVRTGSPPSASNWPGKARTRDKCRVGKARAKSCSSDESPAADAGAPGRASHRHSSR